MYPQRCGAKAALRTMASLVGTGHLHSALPSVLPPATAQKALQAVRWAALPPTSPRPIPAHPLPVRRSAIRLPDRPPFGCSILVGADLHLDDEVHRGNVGA